MSVPPIPPSRYGLYGLTNGNPYAPDPLDPLTRSDDRGRCLELDGFFEVERVCAYLRQALEAERPAIVLVSGRDHTGRTSIANHVLDLYRELKGVGDRFLVSRVEVTNRNNIEFARNALLELQLEIEERGLELDPGVIRSLDQIESIDKAVYERRYQRIARRLHQALAYRDDEPYAFGMLFEGLRKPSLVDAVGTILKSSRAIAVFTHDDYRHADTADLNDLRSTDFHLLRLEPLTSTQVRQLAQARWEKASQEPSPFDPQGLEESWAAPTPIKRALKDLAWLLNYRLDLAADHGPWPENKELAITRHWMVATVRHMSEWGKP